LPKENSSAQIVEEVEALSLRKLKNIYTHLVRLARRYLSAPPSSVFSERLFSEAGNLYEQKRNRLLPKTGEKLLFLHYNLKKQ